MPAATNTSNDETATAGKPSLANASILSPHRALPALLQCVQMLRGEMNSVARAQEVHMKHAEQLFKELREEIALQRQMFTQLQTAAKQQSEVLRAAVAVVVAQTGSPENGGHSQSDVLPVSSPHMEPNKPFFSNIERRRSQAEVPDDSGDVVDIVDNPDDVEAATPTGNKFRHRSQRNFVDIHDRGDIIEICNTDAADAKTKRKVTAVSDPHTSRRKRSAGDRDHAKRRVVHAGPSPKSARTVSATHNPDEGQRRKNATASTSERRVYDGGDGDIVVVKRAARTKAISLGLTVVQGARRRSAYIKDFFDQALELVSNAPDVRRKRALGAWAYRCFEANASTEFKEVLRQAVPRKWRQYEGKNDPHKYLLMLRHAIPRCLGSFFGTQTQRTVAKPDKYCKSCHTRVPIKDFAHHACRARRS